jgi:hypothetical protein
MLTACQDPAIPFGIPDGQLLTLESSVYRPEGCVCVCVCVSMCVHALEQVELSHFKACL